MAKPAESFFCSVAGTLSGKGGAGVVASVRKENARHGLPGFPQGAVNFGVAVRSFGYLTSDCNPTSFP